MFGVWCVRDLGFGVWGLGCEVCVSGVGVWVWGFEVWGVGFCVRERDWWKTCLRVGFSDQILGVGVEGLVFGVEG